MLVLPGTEDFDRTLDFLIRPPDLNQVREKSSGGYGIIFRPGSFLPEAVSMPILEEYLFGGEYDEREAEIESPQLAEDDPIWILDQPWEFVGD